MAKGSSAKKPQKSVSSLTSAREKPKMVASVTAANAGQKNALRAIASPDNHIVFIDGIAGTGKTFISASWGLGELIKGNFDKMIITRPYVEAGENLGFLPGTFDDKIAPFMIPITDVFNEHLTDSMVKDLVEERKIITLPLAYMRGVTFKKSFVILDEAQNATPKQMHLFLTRIGQGSKVVVTGDKKQSDLGPYNGFRDALEILQDLPGLEIVTLDANSVVRHSIISSIDARYVDKR